MPCSFATMARLGLSTARWVPRIGTIIAVTKDGGGTWECPNGRPGYNPVPLVNFVDQKRFEFPNQSYPI